MDNTKPPTSTLKLGLPRLRLTNLKYPTTNRINCDLVKLCKIESPTIYGPSLQI